MNVVIVGGSLAGLTHGIVLRHYGHNVHILEQSSDIHASHMAGVCCAWDCMQFFKKFDRVDSPFALRSDRVQFLSQNGQMKHYFTGPRLVTSWDAYYWRLRANFDGFASSFYPDPPDQEFKGAGKGIYASQCRVMSIETEDNTVLVSYEKLQSGELCTLQADLVLAADGPNSFVRNQFLADSQRISSGYIAWRGTVVEDEVSQETRDAFQTNVTVNLMEDDHALVYLIPGNEGSMEEGSRHLNFLWYTNETPSSLDFVMRDTNGRRRQYIVPSGSVRNEAWQHLLDRAHLLSGPHREVLHKIRAPFIQNITDFIAPRATFANGRILVVGDALSLYRPHTASSANQTAFQAMQLERMIQGEISADEWERRVLEFARIHWSRSVWYGENYQHPKGWMKWVAALRYWWAVAVHWTVRRWWRGWESMLRW